MNVSNVRGLAGDLSQKNFCSSILRVPGQDVGIAGESVGRITVGGVGQVALSSSGLVQPEGCPDQLVVIAAVGAATNIDLGNSFMLLKGGTKIRVEMFCRFFMLEGLPSVK